MSQVALSNGSDGVVLTKPEKPVRMYPCSRCPKTFKRSEHCIRHERGHTQEKPFSCRYCARRYARKDLVNRHEKSFHPLADNIRPLSRERDNINVNDRTMRTPPAMPQQEYPQMRSPGQISCVTHIPEIYTTSHDIFNQSGNGNRDSISTAFLSPPHSESTSLDIEVHTSTSSNPSLHLERVSLALDEQNSRVKDVNETHASDNSATMMDQQVTGTIPENNINQDMADVNNWNPSEMMWTDSHDLAVEEHVAGALDLPPSSHAAPGDLGDNYLNNIDILSMMPRNGVDFEADFSAYLLNSGYSPEEQLEVSGRIRGMSPGPHMSTFGMNQPHLTRNDATTLPNNVNTELGTFARMPSVMTETPRKLPVPTVDLATFDTILADVRSRVSSEQVKEMESLRSQDMQRFITSYFTCFHRHCPIIHIPSLDLKTTSSHLVFAICAIGAMYRLNRKAARDLWYLADYMVEKEMPVASSDSLSQRSTSSVQCRMLLGMFSIFSGELTERAISKSGFWSTEYRIRKSALALTNDKTPATWEQWVSRETSKRLLFGIFIMSSLVTVTYDLCPAFSVTQDLDIEMLDEEYLWEAASREQWEALKKSQSPRSKMTVRDAMNHLIFGKEQAAPAEKLTKWTAFATTMVFHAVNVNMWHVMQCTQSFTAFAMDDDNNKILKASLVSQVETALARCYALLTADRSERDHTPDDPEGPLIFNCLALLRSAYVRVFTGAGNFNRMMLLSEDPLQVAVTIEAYVAGRQERSPFLTRAVDKAYGGLLTPIKAGYLLVQKTAALSWSVEHAVAAWDCALFVTKWIHAMEMEQQEVPPNEEETRNLMNFRELLAEVDSGYDGSGSLAGEVTRIWAGFLDDTWVWGITPRMGQVLRQLAEAFNTDWAKKFPNGNSAGPISR